MKRLPKPLSPIAKGFEALRLTNTLNTARRMRTKPLPEKKENYNMSDYLGV